MADHIIKYVANTDNYNRNVKKAKAETKDFQAAVKGLERQFGLSISQLGKFTAAAGAITGAMKVIKDAFMSNEETVDAWGRTVRAAGDLYDGFLRGLNQGDISGFLDNMGKIVDAAKEAYNAIDELQTFNSFNQINLLGSRTKLTNAITDFKYGGGDAKSVRRAGLEYMANLGMRQAREYEAYQKAIASSAAKTNGLISASELSSVLSGSYGDYNRLKELGLSNSKTVYDNYITPTGYNMQVERVVKSAANDKERMGQALRMLTDDELDDLQKLGVAAMQTENEISNVNREIARTLKPDGKTFSAKLGSMPDMWIKQLNHGKNFMNIREFATQQINTLNADATQLPPLQIDVDIKGAENWRKMMKFLDTAEQLENTGKGLSMVFNEASEAISAFGGESREAAIAASALTFAGTISQLMASFANMMTRCTTIWEWIAGGISGVTALGTMVASMKQINSQKFADGGVVGGDSYSGDRINARLNSGEVVFNQSDASKLYSMVHGSSLGVGSHTVKVKGSDMYILMSNYAKETGKRL